MVSWKCGTRSVLQNLNRCVFNVLPKRIVFFLKENEPQLPVQKVNVVRFSPVQKISVWCKSTFRPFRDPHHDGFSKTRMVQFLFCVSPVHPESDDLSLDTPRLTEVRSSGGRRYWIRCNLPNLSHNCCVTGHFHLKCGLKDVCHDTS